MSSDELHAQLVEIDENLMRSELTATEEAEHLQRRKEIWEAMQERERVSAQVAQKPQGGRPSGFSSETEKATGKSQASTNRATRRAREVCQQARDLIRGTKLDTGAFLDGLIKQGISDEEQPLRKRCLRARTGGPEFVPAGHDRHQVPPRAHGRPWKGWAKPFQTLDVFSTRARTDLTISRTARPARCILHARTDEPRVTQAPTWRPRVFSTRARTNPHGRW